MKESNKQMEAEVLARQLAELKCEQVPKCAECGDTGRVQMHCKEESWTEPCVCGTAPDTTQAAQQDGHMVGRVITEENAAAYLEETLWAFIDAAGIFPKARPDDRTWAHVLAYKPRHVPIPAFAWPVAASAFPERDGSKPAEQQGIFRKFDVRRVDGSDQPGGKHYGCRYFVLDLDHDKHAPAAMRAYAAECKETHPQLSADIEAEFGGAQAGSDLVRLTDEQREAVREAIGEALGDAYDCLRVWSAWSFGRMGPDDFAHVCTQEHRLDELTDAVADALAKKYEG